MTAPTITALPPAPLREAAPAAFSAAAETFVAGLEDLPTEINAFGSYLDGLGLDSAGVKTVVRVASTAAGILASDFENGDTVDGVVLATGDRLLLKNQSAGAENGIYVVAASGAPARASDFDAAAEVPGLIFVNEGTTNGATLWYSTNTGAITIDTTALTFAQWTGGGATEYIFGFFFTTTPTDSETLLIHVAGADFTIPADFTAGLQSTVGTNPTSSFALDVQQDGVSIGTITVSTGGSVTATTTSGTAKSIAAGDVITVIAPGSADATAANMAFTIIGER